MTTKNQFTHLIFSNYKAGAADRFVEKHPYLLGQNKPVMYCVFKKKIEHFLYHSNKYS